MLYWSGQATSALAWSFWVLFDRCRTLSCMWTRQEVQWQQVRSRKHLLLFKHFLCRFCNIVSVLTPFSCFLFMLLARAKDRDIRFQVLEKDDVLHNGVKRLNCLQVGEWFEDLIISRPGLNKITINRNGSFWYNATYSTRCEHCLRWACCQVCLHLFLGKLMTWRLKGCNNGCGAQTSFSCLLNQLVHSQSNGQRLK